MSRGCERGVPAAGGAPRPPGVSDTGDGWIICCITYSKRVWLLRGYTDGLSFVEEYEPYAAMLFPAYARAKSLLKWLFTMDQSDRKAFESTEWSIVEYRGGRLGPRHECGSPPSRVPEPELRCIDDDFDM